MLPLLLHHLLIHRDAVLVYGRGGFGAAAITTSLLIHCLLLFDQRFDLCVGKAAKVGVFGKITLVLFHQFLNPLL
jgi:hypothetical protein